MQAYQKTDRDLYHCQRTEILAQPPGHERELALRELDAWLQSRDWAELWRSWRSPLPAVQHIWDCFWALMGDRTVSVVAGAAGASVITGAIPYVAQRTWLMDHGIEGDAFRRALRLLRAMDAQYRETVNGGGDGDEDTKAPEGSDA